MKICESSQEPHQALTPCFITLPQLWSPFLLLILSCLRAGPCTKESRERRGQGHHGMAPSPHTQGQVCKNRIQGIMNGGRKASKAFAKWWVPLWRRRVGKKRVKLESVAMGITATNTHQPPLQPAREQHGECTRL